MAKFDITAVFKVSGQAELNASFRKVGKAANDLGKSIGQAGRDAARFGRNMAIVGAAGAAALGKTVVAAKDFEESFTSVKTLLDDSSFATGEFGDNVKGLRDGVIALRGESGQSFDTLNKGLFNLISSGVKADEALVSLEAATKLAAAGSTDTATAVDGITIAMGAYGKEVGTAEEISQKFFTAQKVGRTTVGELANSVGLVAATAAASGISFDELLASTSAATLSGIKTNATFTGLKAAITNIQQPSARAAEEANRLGISFDQAALKNKGLVGLLKEVATNAKFTDESFTQLFSSSEARNFIQAVSNDQFKAAAGLLDTLNDKTQLATTYNNAYSEVQNTLSFQIGKFGGIVDSLAVNIGTALAPAVGELVTILSDLVAEVQPDIEAFFTGMGEDLVAFVKGGESEMPKIIDAIKSFGTTAVSIFDTVVFTIQTVTGAVSLLFTGFEAIAFFIPGLSGTTLGLLLIFGQLSGALRLTWSLLAVGRKAFLLLDAALLATGVISTSFTTAFKLSMLSMVASAKAAALRVVASMVTMAASMTTFGGVMSAVGTIAKSFWIAITGPTGIIIAIVAGIALIISKLIGFENILNAVTGAWDAVTGAIGRAIAAVLKFFGASSGKVDVSASEGKQPNGLPKGFATGGHIRGAGTSRSDSILARLSDGEYVVKASSVRRFGTGFLDAINSGVLPSLKGFADGGFVDAINNSTSRISSPSSMASYSPKTPTTQPAGRPLTLVMPNGEKISATTDESTAKKLQRNLRKSDMAKSSQLPAWY